MTRAVNVYRLVVAALLVAIGIIIPMVMPVKVYIPPMSFTLASHVAIFLAMFISPGTALIVALGTTIGFVFSGLPIDVWLRALSHVAWALGGALWLKKNPDTLTKPIKSAVFCVMIALAHGALELLVVVSLYFSGLSAMVQKITDIGFLFVFFLVFVGCLVHSCVDYIVASVIWLPLSRISGVARLSGVK